jgi:hypothetical protein
LVERSHYGYCVFQGAILAKRLGYKRISVIEFGVAGGRGLLNLESHVEEISKEVGIEIEIYGFDTAEGLPSPEDYRDLPYCWKKEFYKMDFEKLSKKLRFAKLIIGNVKETTKEFFDKYKPAPVAAVMYDLDYYSSTTFALRIFEVEDRYLLPRVFTYYDDIIGDNIELHGDFMGERLAINEFNASHEQRKFCPVYSLICRPGKSLKNWHHQIFVLHMFDYRHYNDFVGRENQQLTI